MKAAVLNQYGDANSFSITTDTPEPCPAKNQVKIKVMAAGINPLDYRIRNGELKFFIPTAFPMILGNDAAGVITDIGEDVTQYKIGDRVFCLLDANETPSFRGFAKPGCYAEYAVTRESTLALIPDNIDYTSAAATPMAALTAYQSLNNIKKPSPGQSILINGASGGVGSFAVQIAKAMGLKVTAVASAKNTSMLLSLGADDCIDYRSVSLADLEQKFDMIYDVVANQSYSSLSHLLYDHGIYISNVANASTIVSALLRKLIPFNGPHQRNHHAWVTSNGSDLSAIAKLMQDHQLKPVVDKIFALEEIHTAHHLIESGHTAGKLVIKID